MPRQSIFRVASLSRRHPVCVVLTELTFVAVAVFIAGCASSRVDDHTPASESAWLLGDHTSSEVELQIRSEYQRWRGTPHVLGGTTSRGLDCSAFVQRVFDDAFDLRLPRTTEDQVRQGRKISSRDLEPGDLVFFRPSKTRHVGIYLSGGEFAHVSSSEGVTISRLDLPYWKDAYWTSRRVLPAQTAVRSERQRDHDAPEVVEPTGGGRTGW